MNVAGVTCCEDGRDRRRIHQEGGCQAESRLVRITVSVARFLASMSAFTPFEIA